ncbi:MAG: class I SAM-dependent methyltransferase [Pirellulaceae bacterium]|nr:class I SAM-dependent methyltransferase [Pirellulaceae bacterium]
MLQRIDIPSSIDQRPLPLEIRAWISDARQRIETFQDCWQKTQIEQFVAADYELVYQALSWLQETQMLTGRRFLEWGCGFAVVASLAASLGWDAIGIESESDLLKQGQRTIEDWNVPVELIHGNFLPHGSESLAFDPTLPSLGHNVANAYDQIDSELDDFAMVYAYPWPGEDDFHMDVFGQHAAVGAMLLLFCGPNDVRAWRKV